MLLKSPLSGPADVLNSTYEKPGSLTFRLLFPRFLVISGAQPKSLGALLVSLGLSHAVVCHPHPKPISKTDPFFIPSGGANPPFLIQQPNLSFSLPCFFLLLGSTQRPELLRKTEAVYVPPLSEAATPNSSFRVKSKFCDIILVPLVCESPPASKLCQSPPASKLLIGEPGEFGYPSPSLCLTDAVPQSSAPLKRTVLNCTYLLKSPDVSDLSRFALSFLVFKDLFIYF